MRQEDELRILSILNRRVKNVSSKISTAAISPDDRPEQPANPENLSLKAPEICR